MSDIQAGDRVVFALGGVIRFGNVLSCDYGRGCEVRVRRLDRKGYLTGLIRVPETHLLRLDSSERPVQHDTPSDRQISLALDLFETGTSAA